MGLYTLPKSLMVHRERLIPCLIRLEISTTTMREEEVAGLCGSFTLLYRFTRASEFDF